MKHLPSLLCAAALSVAASSALADISVKFVESAPKDWFSITNNGTCPLSNLTLKVDLRNSAGKLIFDTTSTGAGVEVFQPFEIREGDITLVSGSLVEDGDTTLSVLVKSLEPGKSASFTIDVDDTLKNSELGMIRVSGSEISGAQISISTTASNQTKGAFGPNATLTLPTPTTGC